MFCFVLIYLIIDVLQPMAAKHYSPNIRYKQTYINAMLIEPKLIVGTGPTFTELLSIDYSINANSQSNQLKLKSVSAQSLLIFQGFSSGKNNSSTSPHDVWLQGLPLSNWSISFSCYSGSTLCEQSIMHQFSQVPSHKIQGSHFHVKCWHVAPDLSKSTELNPNCGLNSLDMPWVTTAWLRFFSNTVTRVTVF